MTNHRRSVRGKRRCPEIFPETFMEIESVHEYDIARNEFEYAFACEDFEQLIDKIQEVNHREVVELSDDGRHLRRVCLYHASDRIPAFVSTLFRKDPSKVTQVMEYDRETHAGFYEVYNDVLGKRFVYRSEFCMEVPSPGRTRKRSRLRVEVRLPAVGGRIEKHLKNEFEARERTEQEVCATFLRETWPRIADQVMANWPTSEAFA